MNFRQDQLQRGVLTTTKPEVYHFMVFGPSQFGKSTFINNLLDKAEAKCKRAEVGDGSGESVTLTVLTYTMKSFIELLPYSRPGYDIIKIFDVPDLFDSRLRIEKEEIFNEIRKTLLESGVNTIDAFILFESVKDDCKKMQITLKTAMELFGGPLRASSILLTTKWDRLSQTETEIIESKIESFTSRANIQTQKWVNNCKQNKVSDDEMNKQFSELGSRIGILDKYKVAEMDYLLQKRDLIAEQLKDKDPNRIATEEHEEEIQEAEEYVEDEIIKITEWVELSEGEIERKARTMWENQTPIPGGLILRAMTKIVQKEVDEYIPRIVHSFISIETKGFLSIGRKTKNISYSYAVYDKRTKIVDEEVIFYEFEREPDIKKELSYFRYLLGGQLKPEVIEKVFPTRKVRTRAVIKKIMVNHDRYDFEHYQKLAVELIKNDYMNSIRSQ